MPDYVCEICEYVQNTHFGYWNNWKIDPKTGEISAGGEGDMTICWHCAPAHPSDSLLSRTSDYSRWTLEEHLKSDPKGKDLINYDSQKQKIIPRIDMLNRA